MATESFIFHKGINRNKSRILLSDAELYAAEGFDFEYTGMLMARDPKERGLIVDGPLLAHPGVGYYAPPVTYPWIPKRENLIGWYKFDEGGGSVAANSTPDGDSGGGKLPDLNVHNGAGNFWTLMSGFGSVGGASPTDAWAEIQTSTPRTIGGADLNCCGIFYNPNGVPSVGGVICVLHETNQVSAGISYGTIANGVVWKGGWNLGGDYSPESNDSDWRFLFYTNTGNHYFVKSDGTLTTLGAVAGGGITLNYIHVGVWHTNGAQGNYSCQGSFGDYIIYNSTSLSLTQWAIWYDEQRSRYSMAERSGW